MKEKDIQTLFGRRIDRHGVYELKLCKGPSLGFDRVEPHQERALMRACGQGLYHKISDYSPGEKPFDCFYLSGVPAYVVVVFFVPRKKKLAYCIPIFQWILLKKRLLTQKKPKKSITEAHAIEAAEFTLDLLNE